MTSRLMRFGGASIAILLGAAVLAVPQRASAQRPLGIDVSSYQGSSDKPPTNIVWTQVKSAGIAFAWAKATEGTYYHDADFVYNEVNAKAAGVPIGAYHFARMDLNTGTAGADTEANYFTAFAGGYIKAGGAYLMPMLDAEQASPGTQAAVSTWVNQWCQDVVNYGLANGAVVKPVVYTFTSWASSYLNSSVTQWPLWMASPNGQNPQTGAPNSDTPWTTWSIWQYGGGTISGIEGACDEDVFNGTLAAFNSTYIIMPNGLPVITAQPANLTVWQGSNATFTVSSTNTLHYQWAYYGTNIAGATASSYTITNAPLSKAGSYSVTLSNTIGNTFSSNVFLGVLPPLADPPGAVLAPANMVDWYPADGNANDLFGTVHGIPHGGLTYTNGHSGEAFHFDGSTAYITTSGGNLTPPWTACMWVNYTHTSQTAAGLLENGINSIKLEQYGSATHNVGISQIGYLDSSFNYAVPTNTWTHLAFVASTTGVTLYANGVSQGTITTNNCVLPRAYIGAGYVTSSAKYIDFMLGNLDDLMIFNRTLSAGEISSIYSAGTAGLVRVPQITSSQVNTNDQLVMSLRGFTGKSYTIYSSTNLLTWSSIATVANASGTNSYTVSNITNNPNTFYRVSQPY